MEKNPKRVAGGKKAWERQNLNFKLAGFTDGYAKGLQAGALLSQDARLTCGFVSWLIVASLIGLLVGHYVWH